MEKKLKTLIACCAGIMSGACQQSDQLNCSLHSFASEHYSANYRAVTELDKVKSPKDIYAKAERYNLHIDNPVAHPCTDLTISKELKLKRRNNPDFVFSETNRYFDSNGTLIAVNIQDITSQLANSGSYRAIDNLPIPKGAPTGRYRVESRLVLKRRGGNTAYLLAKADAEFNISD